MQRRSLFQAATAAAFAAPAALRAQSATTLRFTPQQDLVTLDPVTTTAYISRNHGYMVFDTLYGMDASFQATPQMVDGHRVEEDGRRWDLTLREGLWWHDGERVLARDCVASIRRWAKRDPFGATLLDTTDELSAPDDRTIRFRLKRPFPLLPIALGKASVPVCAMMPERLAATDPFRQVPELIGSGPFRFKADERVPGSLTVYSKFERYVPRKDGALGWTSGPKAVHFDRVEWRSMPDPATATSALIAGEQDWQEYAYHDQLPLLRRARGVQLRVLDRTGFVCMVRMNHAQSPFDNRAVRQALWHALDQTAHMQAVVGPAETSLYTTPLGFFAPGTPMASEAGFGWLTAPRDPAKARDALRAAGYRGEPVVLMVPSNSAVLMGLGAVFEDMLKRIGMAVEVYAVEFNAMLQRRNRRGPVAEGGWSLFVTNWSGSDWLNPAGHIALRGNGDAGYAGWAQMPRIEELREAWFRAPDLAAQQAICREIQEEAFREAAYYPLGQYLQPTAWRSSLAGVLDGFATFWNVRRA
ncbi:ABC transporter substrate-binding protein [Paracraurococcus ruber]|uniref:ABC transporter substrate-binding protein n=1 Tax=Paracraurococcus ruber TaxID=77675 RepID=A0ABS1CT17_9PROT|nr:ABC transporter substrate-binding protein [Paracraurococcus ruber]MBK1656989.1 ABC transporter substrate-binding protein [Paracraurococcus ruber]TDG34315.1 ABC transporter substrate-binding protein [Paracraurococcus ruber]